MKRKLAFIIVVILILTLVPFTVLAETHTVEDGQTLNLSTGALTATEGGALITTYTINNGDTISVAPGATAVITGSKNVMISCGAGVTLTINDVTSDVSGTKYACALAFTGTGNTLNLVGNSEFKSWGDWAGGEPGISVGAGTELTIGSETGGSVEATGGHGGAGIGGAYQKAGGNISITGGVVKANGGREGAGIGGGSRGAGGNINITDGKVEAYGGNEGGAGIGGGSNADCGVVNISGGIVEANGGLQSAGIGGGQHKTGGNINISGGRVEAKGGLYGGTGIGGGYGGSGGDINISGGEVYADGCVEDYVDDIGNGGLMPNGGTLEISGDAAVFMRHSESYSLTPTTSYHVHHSDESIAAGTPFGSAYGFTHVPGDWSGTAYAYLTSTLLIDDAYINAIGSTETDVDKIAHTINKINIDTTQSITVKDSNTTVRDIQIEALCGDVKLTIEDLGLDVSGTTNACALAFTGSNNKLKLVGDSELTSSGISSPDGAPGIRVETGTGLIINSVSDGTVTVNGGHRCAGIGGGSYSGSGDIDITGGTVTANGGMYAAGIGGGYRGAGGNINIAGGSVKASGGMGGAGIGCGLWGRGGVIDISGGTVTAEGAIMGGSGIGGGCEINISGGEVYAEGNIANGGQDIGNEASGSGTLDISGDAAVFTKHDPSLHSLTPTTSYHTLHSDESINVTSLFGSAYGFAHIPRGWSGTAYAYLTSTLLIDDAYINAVGTAVTDVDKITHTIEKIDINTLQEITIKDGNKTARDIQIEALCGDVKLTIEDLELDVSSTTNGCALAFMGTGNTLNLVGDSELKSWGNNNTLNGEAGIRVEEGTQLSIGSVTGGKIIVTGGQLGAGIGGGYKDNGGNINIGGDATIIATGGRCGAAIGGGYEGNGGNINIGGDATVTATAESDGGAAGIGGGYKGNGGNINIMGGTVVSNGDDAGIGGGYYGAGGDIDISGGTVEAKGGSGAAGIGGGYKGAWGDIDISGDATVTANGGDHGAGIGGGLYGAGGNINISGGQVYADGSIATEAQDIGKGNHGSDDGVLKICGDAVVFTRHNPAVHSLAPTTSYHSLRSDESIVETSPYGSAYGYTHIPEEWSGTAYAYLWTILLIDDAYISVVGSTETDVDKITHTIEQINIDTTQDITIKDSNITARDIQIEALCDEVKLTIEGLELDVSSTTNGCALAFTGTGNTLNLVGDSEFTSWGHDGTDGEPGIRVESGTALSISSSSGGSVTATGGYYGAGIGGGKEGNGGDINIGGDATVTANGGDYGAGIGGGDKGSGGNINIEGDATVTATSGRLSAGIGGGLDGEGGDIDISGGTVEATGGDGGAGIGGGYGCESGGDIDISGDAKVTANGGDYAAGIGGGLYGSGGHINISGGVVYASGDTTNGAQDIGNGVNSSGSGTLEISGDAAVFLKNDCCIAPTTATHTHEVITSVTDNKVYGIGANGWTPNFGVYMRLYTLTYSANQGTGTVPEPITQRYETTTEVGDNSNLSRYSYTLGGWNTQADSNGTSYNVGDTFEFEHKTTLYAEWNEIRVLSVTLSSNSETIIHHDTLTLTADVVPANATHPEVTWKSSNTDVATVDSSGKVTAVGIGNAVITATADGKSGSCAVTVSKKAVTSVLLSSNKEAMIHHDTLKLMAEVVPANSTYPEMTWESSNTIVATVDESGKVTAVGVGSATITATADGVSDTCSITVHKKAVTSVSLSNTDVTMEIGDIKTLTVQVAPKNATYPKVSWKSSDTAVAEVDSNGMVTAVGSGIAKITVEVDGKSTTCAVTVKEAQVAPTQTNGTDESPAPSPNKTPSEEMPIPVTVVEEDEETGDVVVEIVVADLPKGAEAIQTPGGEIIYINDMDKVEITLNTDEINADGTVDLIALSEEGTPLGGLKIYVSQADENIADTVDAENTGSVWPILMWVLIGLGAVAIGAAGYLIFRKRI